MFHGATEGREPSCRSQIAAVVYDRGVRQWYKHSMGKHTAHHMPVSAFNPSEVDCEGV